MLTDNGTQLISAFIAMLCEISWAKHLARSEYHLLRNWHVVWLNKKVIARLENDVAEHHRDGDIYVH